MAGHGNDTHLSRLVALGRRLRAIRRARGETAEAFGAMLGHDRNYWGRIERGAQNLSFRTLSGIADGLEMDLGELLSGLDEGRSVDVAPEGAKD